MFKQTKWFGLVVTVILLTAGTSAQAANPAEFLAVTYTNSAGDSMPYRLYVPPDYDPGRQYPLVLFLHGYGERGDDNLKQINSNIDNLFAHVKLEPFKSLLLAPQAPEVPLGWGKPQTDLAAEIVLDVQASYSVDRTRTYVTGLSNGGGGTWRIAGMHRNMFAGVVPICADQAMSWAEELASQNIWAFHAVDDTALPVDGTRNTIALIELYGGDPLYTEYTSGGHFIWPRVYNTPELYVWLYSQRQMRPGDYPPAPALGYTSNSLGDGLYEYTFYIDDEGYPASTYGFTLAFEALGGATVRQIVPLIFPINSQSAAEAASGTGTPPYDPAGDTWVYSPFGENISPGVNPLTGALFTSGFLEGPDYYVFSVYGAGGEFSHGAPVAHIVSDGPLRWLGTITRASVNYEVSGSTVEADFNGDGAVNQVDYTIWADGFGWTGEPGGHPADGNEDGAVDQADYTLWADHFGFGIVQTAPLMTVSQPLSPEPQASVEEPPATDEQTPPPAIRARKAVRTRSAAARKQRIQEARQRMLRQLSR